MAKNFVQPGMALTVVAPTGGVVSGNGVKIGANMFGVAQTTQAAGANVVIDRYGVWTLAKAASQAWNVGDLIYWDDTGKACTTVSTANLLIGVAAAAYGNGATIVTGNVLLTP